ncbi:MAG: hypothetical protein FJ139_10190 [Deltaproteobacteria bacterium]|nr:hypothetical protein [Deltaproteobacteria bacterium]
MPKRDGKGPVGQGAGQGRGAAIGQRRGIGRAVGGGRSFACPSGYCVCPDCGMKISHTRGYPCSKKLCPECGTRMVRE